MDNFGHKNKSAAEQINHINQITGNEWNELNEDKLDEIKWDGMQIKCDGMNGM